MKHTPDQFDLSPMDYCIHLSSLLLITLLQVDKEVQLSGYLIDLTNVSCVDIQSEAEWKKAGYGKDSDGSGG